ncbi:ankyrin repeat and SAM domain-containing protein 6 [Trichonephila inaurata madagascariensis]|uniref:Ankyrin repeat and SAM domain-containing protein 6 n=1 Tax=Trichonephila inaurata madagascariensis TaxID=2747483 RepID=A0A8X6WNZ8_9ARAC|nr:ankyrin repeat and SAM domain-containing protein 6 [Trichonephila inaurata madagascariensis]
MNSNQDILFYCQIGNLTEVEKCLKEGTFIDFQNSEGETPLQVSAANGFSQIVSLLISYGASIDLPNSYGWTPLMHAARHGHFSTVAILLKKKAKVNICNKLGLSPVVAAAWSGDLKTVKLLTDAGAIVDYVPSLNQSNECYLSPMMAAALCGHDDIIRFLLAEGVDIDQVSPVTGLSPLMLAACEGLKKVVQIIIENSCDTKTTDTCGRSALDLAVECSNQEVIIYLEGITTSKYTNEGSQDIDIFQAVKSGDVLKVKSILKQNPESTNAISSHDGMTPLMLASMLGYNNIVNILLSSSAKLDAQDLENGWTALMYAIFHRRSQTVELLLKKGASIDLPASNGFTALDLARHLNSSDAAIIENLSSKFLSVGLSSKKMSVYSASDTLDRRKHILSERFFSKRSETQTGLKSWIGGMAYSLQQKMLTRLSPRHSEKYSGSDTLGVDDTIVNDVFAGPKSPCAETETVELHPSVLLSPDKYLAKELKEHKIEIIKPPLPSLHYYTPFNISTKKHEQNIKPSRNSLQVPKLLKEYKRKNLLACSEIRNCTEEVLFEKMDYSTNGMETGNLNTIMNQIEPKENYLLSSKTVIPEDEIKEMKYNTAVSGELTVLLKKESLQKYVENFREHEVDIDTLQNLTKEDLTDIGIQSSASQKKLLEIINKLQDTD